MFLTVSTVGTEVGEKASPERFNGRGLMTEGYLFVSMIIYIELFFVPLSYQESCL